MEIEKLKNIWVLEDTPISVPATNEQIKLFQIEKRLALPQDIIKYFKLLNGTNGEYDNKDFHFYSINEFKSIADELVNWKGVPDYSNISKTLDGYKNYFVFADYLFHMFSYAISLSQNESYRNEVIVICGGEYKEIAGSFSEFIELYLTESVELQLNK